MTYAQAKRIGAETIPIIDIGGLRAGDPAALQAVARDIRAAAERVGFFYVRNHGVPSDLLDDVFAVARRFFTAPEPIKTEAAVNQWHRGFLRLGQAKMTGMTKPDLKESFIWGLDTPGADGIPPNIWPDTIPEMRATLTRWFAAGNEVGCVLLRAIAMGLGVAPDTFVRSIDRPTSRGSVIWYPPQPPEAGADQFGVAPHTDYGCLTLLFQDRTGGLQVRGADGEWVEAHPVDGTFVVNVGDLLARWTNDRFRSTPHRVVNRSGHERMSTAIFVDPNRDTEIAPVLLDGDAAHYPTVTAGEYIKSRLDATMAYRRQETAASS